MKYILPVFLLLCAALTGRAQVQILTPDTVICNGQSATLRAANSGGVPVSTALTTDDIHSAVIPIGFSFTFYGNTYTDCVISSNGYITFNLSKAGTGSSFQPNQNGVIPGNSDVRNSIMGNWTDLNPAVAGSGSIDYAVAGTAPNRKFVVNYCDIPMWSPSGQCDAIKASFQIILYETTNVIEIHLREKVVCPAASWGEDAIEGIQNIDGTIGHLVPGRGYPTTSWTATRSSHRFTPTSATSYTIDPIPFAPVVTTGNGFITWTDQAGNYVGNGYNVVVVPTQPLTTYYAQQVYCADTTIDSVKVTLGGNPHIDSVQKHDPSYCGNNDGSLVIFGLASGQSYRIDYLKNGVPQPTLTLSASLSGTLTMSNLTAGTYANIGVSTTLCSPANRMGPYTLVNPRIPVEFTEAYHFSCGGNDTVVFTNTTPTPGTISYIWRFGDGTSDSLNKDVTHIYAGQGLYNVLLIADNGTCRDSTTKPVDTRHPLDAYFTVDYENACQNQLLHFKDSSVAVTGNGIAPQYQWDFGDGSTGTGDTISHAYTRVGTYTARLVVTDFVPCTDTFYRTIVVGAPPELSFTSSMSKICEGQSTLLTADFHNEQPVSYEWRFSDGTLIRDTNPIRHAFDSSGTFNIVLITHYQFCPDTTYRQQVNVQAFPGINLGPDTALCPNASPVTLRNLADYGNYPGATYAWASGETTPAITVNHEGTYGATISYNGCTATDSITIFKDCYLDIPNSFTPNGDGLNDYFLPRQQLSRSAVAFKMTVYNRWGQIVFETSAVDGRGWDGRFNNQVQPQGVYVYIIDVAFADGRKEHYTDNVTLIR